MILIYANSLHFERMVFVYARAWNGKVAYELVRKKTICAYLTRSSLHLDRYEFYLKVKKNKQNWNQFFHHKFFFAMLCFIREAHFILKECSQ